MQNNTIWFLLNKEEYCTFHYRLEYENIQKVKPIDHSHRTMPTPIDHCFHNIDIYLAKKEYTHSLPRCDQVTERDKTHTHEV